MAEATGLNQEWVAAVAEKEAAGTVLTTGEPGKWAGKEGKHVPQVTVEDGNAKVVVAHGMDPEHWIDGIWAKNQDGEVIAVAVLACTDAPELNFAVPEGTVSITAFGSCNQHDIWSSEATTL